MKSISFLTTLSVTIYKGLVLLLRPSVPSFQLLAGKVHINSEPATLIGVKIKHNQYALADISIQDSIPNNSYSKAHKKTWWSSDFDKS